MNMTQVRVTLQYVATALAAYVSGKGWLPQDVATELSVWLVAGLPIVYGVWKSRTTGKINTAAKVPGVKITAPEKIATKSHKPNVVSSDTTEDKPS